MKLHTRLGTATLAGIFALSAIGAGQAEGENTPETTTPESSPTAPQVPKVAETTDNEPSAETEDRELSEAPQPETTDTSTSVPPEAPPPPSDDESADEPLKDTECTLVDTQNNNATIAIPEAEANDRVEVSDSDHYRVDASSQIVVPYSGTVATLAMTVWRGEVQEFAECSVTISDETPQPTEDPTSPPEETPTDETPPPEPTDPTPTDTSEPPGMPGPTTTPAPEPSGDASSPDDPAPSTPETTEPAQVPPQPTPTSQAPVEQAPPQDGGWDNDRSPSAEPVPQPSNQSTGPIERNIRQHSDNPRHLLSQIWNTDSHNGSGLIMPEPRDSHGGATELETLPPVSEDELEAIKARVSTPDKGNGLASDDLLRADVNERLAHSDTWWLASSVIGLLLLGGGIWWVISRRKPKH